MGDQYIANLVEIDSFLVTNNTSRGQEANTNYEDAFAKRSVWIEVLIGAVGLLGVCGNYATFKSAYYMPETTSKYIMRYLAVWDSWAAVEASINKYLFYWTMQQLFRAKEVSSMKSFSCSTKFFERPIVFHRRISRLKVLNGISDNPLAQQPMSKAWNRLFHFKGANFHQTLVFDKAKSLKNILIAEDPLEEQHSVLQEYLKDILEKPWKTTGSFEDRSKDNPAFSRLLNRICY